MATEIPDGSYALVYDPDKHTMNLLVPDGVEDEAEVPKVAAAFAYLFVQLNDPDFVQDCIDKMEAGGASAGKPN